MERQHVRHCWYAALWCVCALCGMLPVRGADAVDPVVDRLHALAGTDPAARMEAVRFFERSQDTRALPVLIPLLSERDAALRSQVTTTLAAYGAPVVAPLTTALNGSTPSFRIAAAQVLGRVRTEAAGAALLSLLGDGSALVRAVAADGLGQMAYAPAVDPLLHALEDPEAAVRAAAVRALPAFYNPRVLPAVFARMKDPIFTVRLEAALALATRKDVRALHALIAYLQHTDPQVRWKAARGLGEMGTPRALDALEGALADTDADVRDAVAWSFGQIGDPRAIRPLSQAVSMPLWQPHDPAGPDARIAIIEAFVCIGDAGAVPPLLTCLRTGTLSLKRSAALALGLFNTPEVSTALLQALRKEVALRPQALISLQRLDEPRTVNVLTDLLRDGDEFDQSFAVKSLGALRDPRGVLALIARLYEAPPPLRAEIIDALENITGENFGEDADRWLAWWQKQRLPDDWHRIARKSVVQRRLA